MEPCETQITLSLYEQRIKGLEHVVEGNVQLWIFHPAWWEVPSRSRFPSWPEDFEFAAVIVTDELVEALLRTNCWDAWTEGDEHVLPMFPYGPCLGPNGDEFEYYLPRSTSVGDVFVTPDGSLHMVRDDGFLEIGTVNAPNLAGPPQVARHQ